MPDDLAQSLRAWRDRLDPAAAGLSRHGARRTPGLRREEVAAGAGISVNYLVRLEQGRATNPSQSVVASLACTLKLSADESEQLHRLAGLADPTARVASRHLTPSIARILERCDDIPVIVVDPAWNIVEANRMADAYLCGPAAGANAARTHFVGPKAVRHTPEDDDRFARDIVSDLHRQLARHPDDLEVREVVDELLAASDRFARLWAERPVGWHTSSRKTVEHPVVGRITVDCDVLEVAGTDLRIVLWTAAPGTPDASALQLLGVVGLQQVEPARLRASARGPRRSRA